MTRFLSFRGPARRVAVALALLAGTVGSTSAALVACGGGDDDRSTEPSTDASVSLDGFPTPVGSDGGSGDGGGDATARGCGPNGTVATAPTYVFVGPDAGGCNAAQIDALSVDCIVSDGSDASVAACKAFLASSANTACIACVYGAGMDQPNLQRPLYTVDFPTGSMNGLEFASVGGCIAAVDPSEKACAQAVAAATACETDQCGGCGLDPDASTTVPNADGGDAAVVAASKYDLINGCIAAAAVGPCADLETASLDCTTRLFAADAGPVRTCGDLVSSSTGMLTADLTSYLFVACGGGPESLDAGAPADAGKDGSK
jgi:hypothetical protein